LEIFGQFRKDLINKQTVLLEQFKAITASTSDQAELIFDLKPERRNEFIDCNEDLASAFVDDNLFHPQITIKSEIEGVEIIHEEPEVQSSWIHTTQKPKTL
jgi:hypothetical protein